ncbi:GNAT family N-acetyltransferase, partial [Bacillus pseudomycoides]|nr:GNAT family N-acetyltransferase [Bacillus pseudomycoides]
MSDTICIQSYESKYQSEVVDLIIRFQQKEYN